MQQIYEQIHLSLMTDSVKEFLCLALQAMKSTPIATLPEKARTHSNIFQPFYK
jgi:hypothetical protein